MPVYTRTFFARASFVPATFPTQFLIVLDPPHKPARFNTVVGTLGDKSSNSCSAIARGPGLYVLCLLYHRKVLSGFYVEQSMNCMVKLECETYLPYVSRTQQYESGLDRRFPACCVQVYEFRWAARFGNGECDENGRGVRQTRAKGFDFI